MTPEVSLILPVYNVADFLAKCLASIERQTFRDFELICVDDGSTDRSPKILKRFADLFNYCKIVRQENGGLSAARNTGLKHASGRYVVFADSDDFLEPNYLQELYRLCADNDADISCCYFYYYYPEHDFNIIHPFTCKGVFTRDEAISMLFKDLVMQSYAWNKMYRRALFTENNIEFPDMCFEDMATTSRLFGVANKIAVTNKRLYHYTQRKSSILKTPSLQKIDDFLHATAFMRVAAEEDGIYQNHIDEYRKLCRKTGFYSKYYTAKIHLLDKDFKTMIKQFKAISTALNAYKWSGFDCSEYYDKTPNSLPPVLNKKEK